MPSRPSARYKKSDTAIWEGKTMLVLAESQRAMTIEEIIHSDIGLIGLTNQKMARILNRLIDLGVVKKDKSKTSNKMVYSSIAEVL